MLSWKTTPYILVAAAMFTACSNSSSSSATSNEDDTSSSSFDLVGDTFTDARDGQTYRTVTIGSQIWMAENLNYKVDGSRCYGDSIENCTKYGRYYTWVAAQEACPQGWHLPNEREWSTLLDIAGDKLQSTSGWAKDNYEYGYNFNGNDDYGFTALPSRPNGTYAEFWSSTEFPGRCIDNDSIHALYATIYSTEPAPVMTTGMKCGSQDQFFPIRCISNESQTPLDSSTASPAVPPCKTDSTDNCEYGTLKDDRDGQTYKTVKIGNQEWMAENLEYKTDSSFYSHKGLTKYGRYYTWEAALEACPEGWHLPDSTEWATLRESVGEDAAKALSSTTDWKSTALTAPSYYCGTAYIDLVGTDSYGFAVLPAGTYIDDEFDVVRSKTEAWFWTKTEAYLRKSPEPSTSFANVAFFQSDMGIGGLQSKSEKFSVRCIKN